MSDDSTSAAGLTFDYMTLLITQLQNQNPLDPMDNSQMTQQLAQLSQLELTEDMNSNLEALNETVSNFDSSFTSALWLSQLEYCKSLLGKTVEFYDSDSASTLEGTVKKMTFDSYGNPVLTVDSNGTDYTASMSTITGIQE